MQSPIMKPILVLLIVLLAGACSAGKEGARSVETAKYEGRWHEYDVNVVVKRQKGRCFRREITMRRQAGMSTGYRPTHVFAADQQCDDTLDEVRFRSSTDREGYRRNPGFATDILDAFYQVAPIDDHGR